MNATYSFLAERFALNRAIALLQEILTELATQDNFRLRAQQLFGNCCDANLLEAFCQQWGDRCFQSLPPIKICPCEEINGGNALFSNGDGCIYVAQEYLSWQSKHPDAIATVLLEAIGHFLGTQMHRSPTSWQAEGSFAEFLGKEALQFSLWPSFLSTSLTPSSLDLFSQVGGAIAL